MWYVPNTAYFISYLAEVLRCDQDLKLLSNYFHALLQTLPIRLQHLKRRNYMRPKYFRKWHFSPNSKLYTNSKSHNHHTEDGHSEIRQAFVRLFLCLPAVHSGLLVHFASAPQTEEEPNYRSEGVQFCLRWETQGSGSLESWQ